MSSTALEIPNFNRPDKAVKTDRGELHLTPDRTAPAAPTHGSAAASPDQNVRRNYVASIYDPNVPSVPRSYHYDGLLPVGYFALWLGARKAEKSLFALFKAMCDACGANWMTYPNLLGPVPVMYFDCENHATDIDERYREHIQAFAPEQQDLIRKNLKIVKGAELKEFGFDIELSNGIFWNDLAKNYAAAQVFYLDCWYMLTSIKPGDAVTARKAIEAFKQHFPKKTIFLLHHTGNESRESRAKQSPVWLRVMGAERWSGNIAEQSVLTKIAELVICQERFEPKDEEGLAQTSLIDFQVFSRSSAGSPLVSFEPDYGDETNEWKYRRKMVTSLTKPAAAMLRALSGNGRSKVRWQSIPAIIKSAAKVKSAREYSAVRELMLKSYILQERTPTGYEYRLQADSAVAAALDAADSTPAAQQSAAEFLRANLCFADGTPIPGGVPRDSLQQVAQNSDTSWEAVRRAKPRLKVVDETRDGTIYWKWPEKLKKPKKSKTAEQPTLKSTTSGSDADIPF